MISALDFPTIQFPQGSTGADAPGLGEISARWVEIDKRSDHIAQKKFPWEIGNRGNVETAPTTLYQTNIVVSAIIYSPTSDKNMK